MSSCVSLKKDSQIISNQKKDDLKLVEDLYIFCPWTPFGEVIHPMASIAKYTGETKGYALTYTMCEYKLLSNEEKRFSRNTVIPWIKVKPSTIPGAGNGLFANCSFCKGDYISVHIGKLKGNSASRKSNYQCQCKNSIFDASGDHLYLGAHFANDLYYSVTMETAHIMENRSNIRNNNAKFEVLFLVACHEIRKEQEIFVSYNIGGAFMKKVTKKGRN